jgi:hypothetical protein
MDTAYPNLQFYLGQIPSRPDNVYIDDIHRHWYHDYGRLEAGHSYIQWLFPTPEDGMNPKAFPLQPGEAEMMRASDEAMSRYIC